MTTSSQRRARQAAPRLPARVAALEAKVAALEKELAELRPPSRKPLAPSPRGGLRCPGCSLPVETSSRGTCPWCGFVFNAVSATRRARR